MTLHNSLSKPRRKLRYSNGHLADGTREDPPESEEQQCAYRRKDSQLL